MLTVHVNNSGDIRAVALWQLLRLVIEIRRRDAVKSGTEVKARYCLEVDGV